jgi:hypothetical protein
MSERPIDRLRRLALGALLYLGAGVVWLYAFVDQGKFEGSDARFWSLFALVLLVHVAFGWAIREWPAVLLPLVLVPLAVPAGYPESEFGEPLPVWIGQAFYMIVEIPAIAAGVALRTAYDGWRRTPRPSR